MLSQETPTKDELAKTVKLYIPAQINEILGLLPLPMRKCASEEIEPSLAKLTDLDSQEIFQIYWHTWLQPTTSYCRDAYTMLFDGLFAKWERKWMQKLSDHLQGEIQGLGPHRARQLRDPYIVLYIIKNPEEFHEGQRARYAKNGMSARRIPASAPGYALVHIPLSSLFKLCELLHSWYKEYPEPEGLIPQTWSYGLKDIKDQK